MDPEIRRPLSHQQLAGRGAHDEFEDSGIAPDRGIAGRGE